jgi:hypothetical protein
LSSISVNWVKHFAIHDSNIGFRQWDSWWEEEGHV